MAIPGVTVIGDRINPGFKSTRRLVEAGDLEGLQALAVRQRDAGAAYLDLTIGDRGRDDPAFLAEVIRSLQAAVDIPLCFDYPDLAVQEVCLEAYDEDKAGGRKPIVNSLSETRWELSELTRLRPVKLILMSSERVEDGVRRQNKTAAQMTATVVRMAEVLLGGDHGLGADDLIVDIAIGAMSADTEGLTRNSLQAIAALRAEPGLAGIHISGGLTNLSTQLPAVEVAGGSLKLMLENAFLTRAVPLGLDMLLATPWREHRLLDEGDEVLAAFDEFIALDGLDALRRLRKLYAT